MQTSKTALADFRFRELHPRLFIGTMSDRYAGWLGQIYPSAKYSGRITQRSKKLRSRVFEERVLPVESLTDYFEHFPVLEIDFTFYRPLLDSKGQPTQNFHVLRKYSQNMTDKDRVFLKVPQAVCARKVRKAGTFADNETYLDRALYSERFYAPACEILGDKLGGLIFEQEYQRRDSQSLPEQAAEEWAGFFDSIPQDPRCHLEIRTERLLTPELFRVLKSQGIGLVLSHWTWLPSLRRQLEKAGEPLLSRDNSQVVRLITPRGKTYEDTYSRAFPFDSLIEGMLHDSTVEETVEIIQGVVQRGSQLYLFINNRAGGNAPLTAQKIASRFSQ
jgi:uncharacterized protein YecE (DUF72 family)